MGSTPTGAASALFLGQNGQKNCALDNRRPPQIVTASKKLLWLPTNEPTNEPTDEPSLLALT
jgi:hypothetical protein